MSATSRGPSPTSTGRWSIPNAPVRALFLRATARERLGDREGAARDRAEGLRRRPNDELSWVVRGLARLQSDPQGALADFDAALAINPRSKSALENKAHRPGRDARPPGGGHPGATTRPSVTTPTTPRPLGPRGVYHARLGRREAALADARAALASSLRPGPGLHDLPGRRDLRADLEAAARRPPRGPPPPRHRPAEGSPPGSRVIPDDHDFDPIRDQPEFHDLLRAVAVVDQAMAPTGSSSTEYNDLNRFGS